MRYFTYIFLFLSINCHSQELNRFEHWDDKNNKEDSYEISKTEEFLVQNKLQLLEIYDSSTGIKSRFLDNLPYVFNKSGDTIIYLIPEGLFPTTRNDFIEDYINNKNEQPYFIEGIRKDGRIAVKTFYEFRFFINREKLYHTFLSSKLSKEAENNLYNKFFESTSDDEIKKIVKEIKKNGYDIIFCGFMFFTAINAELEASTYSKYLPVSDPAIRNTLNQFM